MPSNIKKIYDYIHNLRVSTKRKNYYFQRRRIERGNGHKTTGWILSDDNSKLATKPKFNEIMEIKRGLENNA